MKVEELDIDPRLKTKLLDTGIEELYPPQTEAVEKGLLKDQNLVVAIPTASGKTLMAQLAIFSSLMRNPGAKAIYLAPLRALASEKYEEFKDLAKSLDLKVAISTGDMEETSGWLKRSDIIIATNEKFDSLIRHQVSWLNDIQVIISDEVHLINDSDRGPVLEVVLSLIRRNLPDSQIVALSATIINADEIADWLQAELVLSSWRPVELKEGVWEGGRAVFKNNEVVPLGSKSNKDGYVSLATDIVEKGGQALVFTNTRKSAMASADAVSKALAKILPPLELEKLYEIANSIRSTGEYTKLRERLAKAVEGGAAFHHAGLASGHRKIIEDKFKQRIIKTITATPTLAAGVNLPGRRVIIRSLNRYSVGFGYSFIPVLEYKQMAGRAGRPRYDPYGEAIIIAKSEEEISHIMDRYINAETEEIYSKLGTEPALRAHILAFIAADYVDSYESALEMIAITFYGFQYDGSMYLVEEEVLKVFDTLTHAKLISPQEPYQVTPFGRRVSELYLDPLSADLIKRGLETVKNRIDLPIVVYMQLLVNTPDIRSYSVREKDMQHLFDVYEEYQDDWITPNEDEYSEFQTDIFFASLKVAKVIDMWLEESSEEQISVKFGVTSGDLHSILQRVEWLVHCAAEISRIFKWKQHRAKMKQVQNQLKYGIQEELLPLVEIRGVGRIRARTMFDAGITTVDAIKKASVDRLAKLPGFGVNIAQNIKNAVSDGSTTDEESIVVSHQDSREQMTLSDFFD